MVVTASDWFCPCQDRKWGFIIPIYQIVLFQIRTNGFHPMKPMFIGKLFTILSFGLMLCFSLLLVPTQATAEIDKSKLIKQKGILKTDGTKSSASIFIGASSDNGVTTSDNFLNSENVLIEAVIEFDTEDVGKSGDIFVVMRKGSGKSKSNN